MKKSVILFLKLSFLGCILVGYTSCGNEDINLSPPEEKEQITQLKALSIDYPSVSNPTLHDDWENVDKIYLNGGSFIYAPWVVISGNTMDIPDQIRTDIKRENGWKMLSHTMLDQNSAEPNYMLFYQKTSGILKVFYFSPQATPNANAKWVISSSGPSSIIPSNTKEYHLSTEAMSYGITSNIVNSNEIISTGHLSYGWNCFTFELPYGDINNTNPIINITGYNVHSYELNAQGSLSGQVIVPSTSTSNSLDSWKNHLSNISTIAGATETFAKLFENDTIKSKPKILAEINTNSTKSIVGVIGIIKSAASVASSILGGASFLTSKTENVTNRYNFSGEIKLSGSVVGNFGGLIPTLPNIDINRLNDNEPSGVWGLKEAPSVTIPKYGIALAKSEDAKNAHYRIINLEPRIQKSSVIINPSLLPLIKDYKVSIGKVFASKSNEHLKTLDGFIYRKIENNWYCAEVSDWKYEMVSYFDPSNYESLPNQINVFYLSYMNVFPETYVSVVVEIEYNDGSVFSSSRVFKLDGIIDNNKQKIIDSSRFVTPIFL